MDIPRENILNLNKSRMRAVYYRSNGQPTMPLPADPYSVAYYFAKGFTARPKVVNQPEPDRGDNSISCPTCGFEAKSEFGLKSHQRKHKKEERK